MSVTIRGADIKGYSDANGNVITGVPAARPNASVEFKGKNCRVDFGDRVVLQGNIVFHADDSTVRMEKWAWFDGRITLGHGCEVIMGEKFYSGWGCQMTAAEGAKITFGEDVLVANACRIRADDSHPIYDGVTGDRINPSRSILVEDHVWIGQEVFVMPGARISTGSVIGARSVVTKTRPVPPHCIAVGSPAEVVREDINWVRKHLQYHEIPESVPPIFTEPKVLSRSDT